MTDICIEITVFERFFNRPFGTSPAASQLFSTFTGLQRSIFAGGGGVPFLGLKNWNEKAYLLICVHFR
jgi:hypothetical protein